MAGAPIHHLEEVVPRGSLASLIVPAQDEASLADGHLSRQRAGVRVRFQVVGVVVPAGDRAVSAETLGMGYGGCQVVDPTGIGALGVPYNGRYDNEQRYC